MALDWKENSHLWSCEHIYHPMYLISLMVAHRRCMLCKAPFHQRLYELFGLEQYMPINWECDPENTTSLRYGVGGYIITSTIKTTSALKLIKRMITKKLSGCTRSWSVLDLKIKERKFSSTSASTAIGMSRI
jgi:hypothetical protein